MKIDGKYCPQHSYPLPCDKCGAGTYELLLIRLIAARREVSKRKKQQKCVKPNDTQSQIQLGGRLKGLQQAIDIIKAEMII